MLFCRGIVAAMVPDLVENSAMQKVRCGRRVARPAHFLPAEPVADLRVPDKEHHAPGIEKFERENKARLVGAVVELDCKVGAYAEPVMIDATPRLVCFVGVGWLPLILLFRLRQDCWSVIKIVQELGRLF